MSHYDYKPNKVTLLNAIDSLLAKSRLMTIQSLLVQYQVYCSEIELYHPECEPVTFIEWFQITYRTSLLNRFLEREEQSLNILEWLQRELESLEIPTWRDVPTGDRALDSEEEYLSDQELQEEQEESASRPWLPEQDLFARSETEYETEEFTDVSESDNELVPEMDFTEEIKLERMFT